ncbi:MAG TPA: elongation factor G [Novosphingobium sp.]|nr:elongation factor G [Novosphingobium sp.]
MDNSLSGTSAADGNRPARAIALVGPAGTGKTSLAEALLQAGSQSGHSGSRIGDTSPEARARGGSTEINLSHFTSQGDAFTLIDVPGGAGFVADGLAALACADLALVVIDPLPERATLVGPMLRDLDALGIPHAIVINRIETAPAGTVHALIEALQPLSSEPLALRQIPIREGDAVTGYVDLALERAYHYQPGAPSQPTGIPAQLAATEQADRGRLLDSLADFDDALLEALLLDEVPEIAHIMADLAEDTARNRLVPVLLTSALTGGGVRRLLKLLRHETPWPAAAAARIGAGDGVYVFKVWHGAAVGRLAFARVFGAPLAEGEELVAGETASRCGALFAMMGEKTAKVAGASVGEVVALSRMDGARAGMVLARKGGTGAFAPAPDYPPANTVVAIVAHDRKDDVRLATALQKLREEDPVLHWQQDEATHETLLRGVSEEHLAVVLARLQRRYGVSADTHRPSIAYRESIRKGASQRGRHKKQSGGHGQFGDVVIEISPRERGEGFVFAERITGGAVPKQWIPAVELGVRDALEAGPLGFPVVDVAVILVDGSFHSVDSSELAFRIAGRLAMSEALAAATPFLLEPICKVVIDTPAGSGSKAGSVVSSRRGQILGLSPHPEWAGWERVEALLPEAGLYRLEAELRSLSQGLATFTASFDHLAELAGKQAQEVVRTRQELTAA